MPKAALLLAALLPLAACASVSPEARVRVKLVEAGLSPRMSGCMAHRMVDRLSIAQLRRLQSLGGLGHRDVRQMSVEEFLHRIRALQEPEIVHVVTKSALVCALDT